MIGRGFLCLWGTSSGTDKGVLGWDFCLAVSISVTQVQGGPLHLCFLSAFKRPVEKGALCASGADISLQGGQELGHPTCLRISRGYALGMERRLG